MPEHGLRPDHHQRLGRARRSEAEPQPLDIGVKDGKFAASRPVDRPGHARRRSSTAAARSMFPGVVDAHQHWGIYNPLGEDADSARAARRAQGGVTTGHHLHAHRRSTT